MKEQSRRIELMEEHMQQERLKHQRDMQQVLQQTQDETSRIKDMYRRSDRSGYSHGNDTITSSNPYEIYDGNTTYGSRRPSPSSPQRSPMKFHLGASKEGPDARHEGGRNSRLNASYLPQEMSHRPTGVPFPKPNSDSFILESKYQQHHNPHSKYSESYFDQNPGVSNQDYSIGVPVFTPGKEEKTNGFADSTSQQKTPLRSASKNVNFQDNKHDIKPLCFAWDNGSGSGSGRGGNGETKDIFPPPQQSRGDIAPNMSYTDVNPPTMSPQRSPTAGRYRPDTSFDFTQSKQMSSPTSHRSPTTKSSPFAKESIWPDYQNDDFSTKDDNTYSIAKSTVNRPDSSVAPILKRDVPEDEGEFMSYLEDFQKEIRHLQFNTTHNKGA
jgi:hypothetical protein